MATPVSCTTFPLRLARRSGIRMSGHFWLQADWAQCCCCTTTSVWLVGIHCWKKLYDISDTHSCILCFLVLFAGAQPRRVSSSCSSSSWRQQPDSYCGLLLPVVESNQLLVCWLNRASQSHPAQNPWGGSSRSSWCWCSAVVQEWQLVVGCLLTAGAVGVGSSCH